MPALVLCEQFCRCEKNEAKTLVCPVCGSHYAPDVSLKPADECEVCLDEN